MLTSSPETGFQKLFSILILTLKPVEIIELQLRRILRRFVSVSVFHLRDVEGQISETFALQDELQNQKQT